jgi:hypothetical protein
MERLFRAPAGALCLFVVLVMSSSAFADDSAVIQGRKGPGNCDDSIKHNLQKALPDLINKTNKKIVRHVEFYEKMEAQGFLSPSLARKVERAEQIVAEALSRAIRVIEKSEKKSEKFEAKLEKRICRTDAKWHKIEARIEKLADDCNVSEPAYDPHTAIPVTVECSDHNNNSNEF